MYRLDKSKELTPAMVDRYIEKDKAEQARKHHLIQVYRGKQDILSRTNTDSSKPNNRIANPFPHYITDTMTGYFLGEPIDYNSEDADFLDVIKEIYNYNDEAAENSEVGKYASICGEAYEMLYIDEDKKIRFKWLNPEGCIPIYDNTVEEELLYFIRFFEDEDIMSGNKIQYVQVYSRTDIKTYKRTLGAMELINEVPHLFKAVPIIVFKNNEEQLGDFEVVLPLIDAYDKVVSDNVNDFEYFVDSYLVLSGMMGTEAEDIATMKENRVLLLDNDASADWLTKTSNDTAIEDLKNRLAADIHKFSSCPSMTDENFAVNASGVAIRYKLMGLENTTSKKERAFKKALQRRLEVICNMLYLFGSTYDYKTIDIKFIRNIPSNLSETAEVLSKIGYLLSNETQIGMLPLDLDPAKEVAAKQAEEVKYYSDGFEQVLEQPN